MLFLRYQLVYLLLDLLRYVIKVIALFLNNFTSCASLNMILDVVVALSELAIRAVSPVELHRGE